MSDDQRSIYLESAHQDGEDFTPQVGMTATYNDEQGRTFTGRITETYPEDDEYIVTLPGGCRLIATAGELTIRN
jgi:hypothetical protein